MILVDSSVWIDHFRGKRSASYLPTLLGEKKVLCHPWIYGEISLGNLGPQRKQILEDLAELPFATPSSFDELSGFIEKELLYGRGLSLVDIHLLHTCLAEDHLLWTRDRVLSSFSLKYKRLYDPHHPF